MDMVFGLQYMTFKDHCIQAEQGASELQVIFKGHGRRRNPLEKGIRAVCSIFNCSYGWLKLGYNNRVGTGRSILIKRLLLYQDTYSVFGTAGSYSYSPIILIWSILYNQVRLYMIRSLDL